MHRTLKTFLGLMAVSVATTATAALPAYYQRNAEIQAILDSRELKSTLGDRLIDAVSFVSPDRYEVRGGQCRVTVQIISMPQAVPGPRAFSLKVGPLRCPARR